MFRLMFVFSLVVCALCAILLGDFLVDYSTVYADEANLSAAIKIVETHLDAIYESDYSGAEDCFSEAFRAVILPKVTFVNSYLLSTKASLGDDGYVVLEAVELEKPEYVLVTLSIAGHNAYYYLILEQAKWRIEIYSDKSFNSFADARRELYLFTDRDWNDDISKELKCIAALYRVQQALEEYKGEKGEGYYPERLRGGNDRDELTIWNYFDEDIGYPLNFFRNKPMKHVPFNKPSTGDFTYISVDRDSDGKHEAYYMISWGMQKSERAIFEGYSIVSLLASEDDKDSRQIVDLFVRFAKDKFNIELVPNRLND